MATYRVRILDAATKDLGRLDQQVGRRILRRLNWLAANFENIRPEIMTAQLSGLYKLRVGSYRVLYDVLLDERLIAVHRIGHRRDVYRVR